MTRNSFSTPIAFIIFNRPEVTLRVFTEIAKIKPSKLLVIGDGPRKNILGEEKRVLEVRAIINQVNWSCEVYTNFSDVNLGCKSRVSSGLDWVFSLVEEAIILEDDCLPSPSFFAFCQEMLEKYRMQHEIGMISGINFQKGIKRGGADYYFSKYMHIWGWATWRDRWVRCYDVNMKDWPSFKRSNIFYDTAGSVAQRLYWKNIFTKVYDGKIDTWDYQWIFANWRFGRLSVIPNTNLISNIGFGEGATHTKIVGELSNLPSHQIKFPLMHPDLIKVDMEADEFTEKNYFSTKNLTGLFKKLKEMLWSVR